MLLSVLSVLLSPVAVAVLLEAADTMAMADTVVVSAVKDILEKKSNAQCNE